MAQEDLEFIEGVTPDISTMIAGDILFLGECKGSVASFSIVGSTFVNEDSVWDFKQSNDRTNWSSIGGTATFTGENAANQFIDKTITMRYVALVLSTKNTETAGINTYQICIK